MSFLHLSIKNLITKISVSALSMVAALCVPLITGPEMYGVYTYVMVSIGFVIPVTSMGFGAGTVYLLSAKRFNVEEVLWTKLLLAVGMAFGNSFIFYLAIHLNWLGKILTSVSVIESALLVGIIFCQTLSFFAGRVLYGIANFSALNRLDLITGWLNPVCIILAFIFWPEGGRVTVFSAVLVFSFMVMMGYFLKFCKQPFQKQINRNYLSESFHYGYKSWFGDIALRANLRMDQLLLGWFVPAAALGVYSLGVRLVEIIWYIPDSVGPVLFNRLAVLTDPSLRLETLAKSHRLVWTVCILITVLWSACIYGILLPWFFNNSYSDLFIPYLILLPGTLLFITYKMATKLFSSGGQVILTSYIAIGGSFISIVLSLLWIPHLGIYGAAWASTLAYISMGLMAWGFLKLEYQNINLSFFVVKQEDVAELKSGLKKIFMSKSTAQ